MVTGGNMNIPKDAYARISTFRQLLDKTPEKLTAIKLKADAWSLKEILGHLVDSACNNHQRFVRLQQGNLENYPGYQQEFWAKAQQVNTFDWTSLIQLWYNYNLLLLHVITHIPDHALNNTWQYEQQTLTLQWLVQDYFRHLFHHMQQFEERKAVVERL
jgi:hypothetical protein